MKSEVCPAASFHEARLDAALYNLIIDSIKKESILTTIDLNYTA